MVNMRVICDNGVNVRQLRLIASAVRIADEAYAGRVLGVEIYTHLEISYQKHPEETSN
ncbi:hypothetical protein MNBD_GAMMA13-2049 [hydrothermal vent metagenome]|uniref:Uncharacterized protein n=1 Tax=hydrothermal vent metagenome TaxID=652676 RepID=A0A3B0Z0K5_9ZZZZ